jgi:hypothetical protein
LDGTYTVFGIVIDGMEVVKAIEEGDLMVEICEIEERAQVGEQTKIEPFSHMVGTDVAEPSSVSEPFGRSLEREMELSREEETKEEGKGQEEEITPDMLKLLYLIGIFGRPVEKGCSGCDTWMKDVSLKAYIYQAIVEGVFDYDYAPASVLFSDGRVFVNVSQEAEDDLNDLRELHESPLEFLQLTTSRHHVLNAYRVNEIGMRIIEMMSPAWKAEVNRVVRCSVCQSPLVFEAKPGKEVGKVEAGLFCPNGHERKPNGLSDIEDVSYVSSAFFIKYPDMREKREGKK